jgi:hypothetical protein
MSFAVGCLDMRQERAQRPSSLAKPAQAASAATTMHERNQPATVGIIKQISWQNLAPRRSVYQSKSVPRRCLIWSAM